ncbi:hypothetical protein BC629DRAFT_819636 [Irpex lacteus]|nr:hypothetical protein BC629DRAFT_819636 [Irpex lacteus]
MTRLFFTVATSQRCFTLPVVLLYLHSHLTKHHHVHHNITLLILIHHALFSCLFNTDGSRSAHRDLIVALGNIMPTSRSIPECRIHCFRVLSRFE